MKRNILIATLMMLTTAFALPLAGQNSRPRRESRIRYHDGQVLLGTKHIYFIFYGNWEGSNTPNALTDFVISPARHTQTSTRHTMTRLALM